MLSLEAEERSCPETVAAAVDACIAQDAGLSALQGCMAADGDLRLRYMQVSVVHDGLRLYMSMRWLLCIMSIKPGK